MGIRFCGTPGRSRGGPVHRCACGIDRKAMKVQSRTEAEQYIKEAGRADPYLAAYIERETVKLTETLMRGISGSFKKR